MQNGWIKLHRQMVDKGFYTKSQYVHLWIHLLLSANHEPKEFMWNGNIILVKEGRMITGRKQLSHETGIPESTVTDILIFLEKQHQIQQQKTNKYRLITIVNWIKHQTSDRKSNNTPTSSQQHADTNKNVRSIRMKENTTAENTADWSLKEEIGKLEESPRRDLNIIALYLEEKKPDIRNKGQFSTTLKRHLRSAKQLIPFEDSQIIEGMKKAKKMTEEWTLETIIKYVTK
jgi:hypothetical protein